MSENASDTLSGFFFTDSDVLPGYPKYPCKIWLFSQLPLLYAYRTLDCVQIAREMGELGFV